MSDIEFTADEVLTYLQSKYENMSDVVDVLIYGLDFLVTETTLSTTSDDYYYLQCAFRRFDIADEVVINIEGNEEMINTFCNHYLPHNIDEIKSMCEKEVA